VVRMDEAQARYVEIVKATLPRTLSLAGLRVAIDCANGASYKVAPTALYELGAEVVPVGVGPNGYNINEGVRLDLSGGPGPRGSRVPGRHRPGSRRRRRPAGDLRREGPGDRRRPDHGLDRLGLGGAGPPEGRRRGCDG